MKRLSIQRKHSKRLGKKGYWSGYNRGQEQGRKLGQASFGKVFEGVSIIIPSCNQLQQLRACIHHLEENTTHPHEIIVVDYGSTDGTPTYLLRKSIAVRYALLTKDVQRIGSLNQGLMMAKGTTIVVLDPYSIVTPGWLDRLMSCLNSDPRIGVVGPVTNGPFGEQQVEVPDMNGHEVNPFAMANDTPNPEAWRETKSLATFCLLLRRETLVKTGYWDEGCHSSEEAHADWLLRVRLLGIRMAIARDAFIHFAESDRDTVDGFPQTTERSGSVEERSRIRSFFLQKWGNAEKLFYDPKFATADSDGQGLSSKEAHLSAASFYPVGALVQGPSGAVFRIEPGSRRRLHGASDVEGEHVRPVRVSQLDLLALPLVGEPDATVSGSTEAPPVAVTLNEPLPVLAAPELGNMSILPTLHIPAQRKRWIELLYAEGGQLYQIGNGWKRPFLTFYAVMSWRAEDYPIQFLSSEDLLALPEKQPIIAPPVLRGHL
ncbi:glycosyltransferase family 2 protein [Paenibacillus polymyxa]|nr:glycosyltransferase family 2 protein [Paenibacillus polymyxa]